MWKKIVATATAIGMIAIAVPRADAVTPSADDQAFIDIGSINKTTRGDYKIKVLSITAVQGGIDVHAQVWDKNDKQIGMGPKGTVDIESFKIFNMSPLIEVPVIETPPEGTVIQDEVINGQRIIEHYRADAREALLRELTHTMGVKKHKFDDKKIKPGKVGNTTTTVYPAAGAVSPVDGNIQYSVADNATFTDLRDQATASTANNTSTIITADIKTFTDTDEWLRFTRGVAGFDASGIDDSEAADSATLSFVVFAKVDDFTSSLTIDRVVPADTSSLATGDYDRTGWSQVRQATDVTIASINADDSTYNDFTINATGLGNISVTGLTWYGMRISEDFDGTEPTWTSNDVSEVQIRSADNTGTTKDPKLVIESSVPVIPPKANHHNRSTTFF